MNVYEHTGSLQRNYIIFTFKWNQNAYTVLYMFIYKSYDDDYYYISFWKEN